MSTYSTLRSANRARQAEWDKDNKIDLSYRGNELAGETGEACNVIKKLERERLGIRGSRATVAQLAEELADVVICADLIAMAAGIDLDAAVRDKFNATSEKVGLETRLIESPASTLFAVAAASLDDVEIVTPQQARLVLALHAIDPSVIQGRENCTCDAPDDCDECGTVAAKLAFFRSLAFAGGAA